jgi:hypothetical protein
MRKRFTTFDFFLVACILIGSTYLFFWYFYYYKTYTKDQIDKMFEPITSRYGIRIVYEAGNDFLSDLVDPIIPAGPARYSKVTPIRHRVLARYPQILQKAFAKYPDQIIKTYLKAIHFAGEIDQHGFKCSGSYDPFRKIVFLVNSGNQSEQYAISTFHHEFSSLLLKSHSFFLNPWEDLNPEDFKYAYETTEDKLKTYNSASSVGTDVDYERGFMDSYGQTEFENDFNEYSAMIFTYPEKFKKIMNKYPRVRGKFLVWLDFYQKIDPIFTESYLLGDK